MTIKRLMILAAMLTATACGDDAGSDDGDEGNEESGSNDAGRDAGRDAQSGDVEKDAGKGDAGKADAGKADAGGNDAGKADAGGTTSCDELTYEDFGRPFLDQYCASCHAASKKGLARLGAPSDAVFDTLTQVEDEKVELKRQVVELKAMPAGSKKPTQAERDQFGAWLDCGPN